MDQKNIKPKILFVADKWCAGNKNFGRSEWEGNHLDTLRATNLAEVEEFHFDEYFDAHQERGDKALLKKLGEWKPDMIITIIYNMPGSQVNTPEFSTFKKIRDEFHIPVLAIWGDPILKDQVKQSEAILPYVTFNAATEASSAVSRLPHPEKYVYMWVAKNPEIFKQSTVSRDIDIGYVGSPKDDRLRAINYMIEHGVNVIHTGGERQANLNTEDFARVYQRSKIALSFSRVLYSHAVNARPFEAMICGAMVLEQESFEMPKLYIPFVDYVPYKNRRDMVKKAKYYLTYESERKVIAENGYRKTLEQYSPERFWKILIDKTLGRSSMDDWPNNLPLLKASDLSKLSGFRSMKLRFLDRMCSTQFGNDLYVAFSKSIDWRFWRQIVFKNSKVILRIFLPTKTYKTVLKKAARYVWHQEEK